MNKWFRSITALSLSLVLLVSFFSCTKDSPETHDCSRGEYVFALTSENAGNCQQVGYKIYTCECGFSYRVYNTEKGDHVFSDTKIVIIEADYENEGMKAYRCTIPGCGAHDPDSEEAIPRKSTTFPPISGNG